jgi:hypothetical protein
MVNLHTMYTGLELVTANLYMGAELALLYNDITITTENQWKQNIHKERICY